MKKWRIAMAASLLGATLLTAENSRELVLDGPQWEPVTPGIVTYARPEYKRAFFPKAKRLSCEGKEYSLTKEFTLKEAPLRAIIQYAADGCVMAPVVNGAKCPQNGGWPNAALFCVGGKLHEGKNTLSLNVSKAKENAGIVADLFVLYNDGTSEHILTDDSFASAEGKVTASEVGKILNGESAWSAFLPYVDPSLAQISFTGGKITPANPTAGDTVRVRLNFKGPAPADYFAATVNFIRKSDNKSVWTERVLFTMDRVVLLQDGGWQLAADLVLPEYISGDDYKVTFYASELFALDGTVPYADLSMKTPETAKGYEAPIVTKVESTENGPVFTLNGEPFYGAWSGLWRHDRLDGRTRFGDAPMQAVTVIFNEGWGEVWWQGVDKYDFTLFDRIFEKARRDNPGAYFLFNLNVYPPAEWVAQNPGEMCLQDTGNPPGLGRVQYSIASDKAKKDMTDAMTKALEYLESRPYSRRIIAYKINSGDTTEWLAHRFANGHTGDFSEPSKRKFAEYCQKFYPEIKDPHVPTYEEQCARDDGEILWDVQKHLNTIAYNRFYSDTNAQFMIDMCTEARKVVGYRKMIGSYYGYTYMVGAGGGDSVLRAHFAAKKVLDSGAVDFLMSPQCYSNRNFGDVCGDMKPFASMWNHNIIPILENDMRTHNGWAQDKYYCASPNEELTLAAVTRDHAGEICRGHAFLSYGLCAHGYDLDFPAAARMFSNLRTTGEFSLEKGFRRNCDVAIVACESAITATSRTPRSEAVQKQLLYLNDGTIMENPQPRAPVFGDALDLNLTRFGRSGAAVDYLLAEDLCDNPGDYKVYFFLNCFNYDQAFLDAIEKLKERECTLVWLYAPGYSFEKSSSLENMKRLTGFNFVKLEEAMEPSIKLNDGTVFSTPITPIKPLFSVKDAPAVEALGSYVAGGQTAVAKMKTGKATSIFYGYTRLEVPFIMDVLKQAGAFVYSETSDPVEANEHLFTLHARFAGKKTIHLPKAGDVLDIMNGKIVARNVDTFTFDAPLHSTWFFYYGDDADALLQKLNENLEKLP